MEGEHEQLLDMHFFAPRYSEEEILVGKISFRIISLLHLTTIGKIFRNISALINYTLQIQEDYISDKKRKQSGILGN